MPKTTLNESHISTAETLFEDLGFSPEEAAVLRLEDDSSHRTDESDREKEAFAKGSWRVARHAATTSE